MSYQMDFISLLRVAWQRRVQTELKAATQKGSGRLPGEALGLQEKGDPFQMSS